MREARAVVIVPTFNERPNIDKVVTSVLGQDGCLTGLRLHVLVVDWASTDGTPEWVAERGHADERVHLLLASRRGLGAALMQAYEHIAADLDADFVVQMDGDLSHDPSDVASLLAPLRDGHDLTIGSRYAAGGAAVDWPAGRRALSTAANLTIRALTGEWRLREWTSGYRAFRTELYRQMDTRRFDYVDYTLQPAFMYEALRVGARVREVPIVFVNRKWGRSKLPMLQYSLNLLRHFARVRWRMLTTSAAVVRQRLPD